MKTEETFEEIRETYLGMIMRKNERIKTVWEKVGKLLTSVDRKAYRAKESGDIQLAKKYAGITRELVIIKEDLKKLCN